MKDDLLPFGVHWFRRDLRVHGNSALEVIRKKTKGRVLGIFCFDEKFLERADFSHNRFGFFLETLQCLKSDMESLGLELLVVNEVPEKAFPKIFDFWKNKKKPLPKFFSWNRDYEPYARARDAKISSVLENYGMESITARDHLLFEPHEITKDDAKKTYYQIYTPFSKKWISHSPAELLLRSTHPKKNSPLNKSTHDAPEWKLKDFPYNDALEEFTRKNQAKITINLPLAGHKEAKQILKKFREKIENYSTNRDFPSIAGTSRLSIYLKNGSITSAEIISELDLLNERSEPSVGKEKFLKEIIWREFYYSILFHEPRVENEAFLKQFKNLPWLNNKEWFRRWCEGSTGFPIVDAGMRELNSTGWMHNRVRMIVASFLTKDLLIDWRWGENYFMQFLLDGDLAPNNGSWQWAASTGCDPQPYFRIFNPWLQGERFDPDALYIKKFVPELKNTPAKEIHFPEGARPSSYPRPIVSHKTQQSKALAMYKSASGKK